MSQKQQLKHPRDDTDDSHREDDDEYTSNEEPRGERVEHPRPMDIICGRGSRLTHPGNKRFRQLVLEQKDAYQKALKREEKTKITLDIVQRLMTGAEPSRFLLKDSKANCWHVVGFEYAKEKVSHALRSRPTEDRRKRPKLKRKVMRKPSFSPELEDLVQGIIADQQVLLQNLIDNQVPQKPVSL